MARPPRARPGFSPSDCQGRWRPLCPLGRSSRTPGGTRDCTEGRSRRPAYRHCGPCSDRVPFDVSRGRQQIGFVHNERRETSLPRIASPVFAEVDPPRVATMRFPDCPTQTLLHLRNRNQVNVEIGRLGYFRYRPRHATGQSRIGPVDGYPRGEREYQGDQMRSDGHWEVTFLLRISAHADRWFTIRIRRDRSLPEAVGRSTTSLPPRSASDRYPEGADCLAEGTSPRQSWARRARG